jgi:hypothetical protein
MAEQRGRGHSQGLELFRSMLAKLVLMVLWMSLGTSFLTHTSNRRQHVSEQRYLECVAGDGADVEAPAKTRRVRYSGKYPKHFKER